MLKSQSVANPLLGILLMLAGCSEMPLPKPEIDTSADAQLVDGYLYPVTNSGVDYSFVDRETDFSRYQSLTLEPLNVNYLQVIENGEQRTLSESELQRLQRHFAEEWQEQLEESQFALNENKDRDRLLVSVALLRLEIAADGSGVVSIAGVFRDATSGRNVIKFLESEPLSGIGLESGKLRGWSALDDLFNHWGYLLRHQLNYWLERREQP